MRVTAPNRIGKVFRFKIRSFKAPSRKTLCLPPGAKKPRACKLMAVKQGHLLAIGGVTVVALAAGFGGGARDRRRGRAEARHPASKPAELPAVKAVAAVRVASLGAAPALPAPKRPPSRKSGGSSSGGSSGSTPSTPRPSSTPAPSTSTPAPQTSTPAPVTPQQTTAPAPERTPVVGGGTGGEEP